MYLKYITTIHTEWEVVFGWPESSFGFFHNILHENPNEHSGQLNKWDNTVRK